jgi:hypothetical protein
MKTRSQTKLGQTQEFQEKIEYKNEPKRERREKEKENIVLYIVEIDFDEASRMWKANKKSIGNGSYKYICSQITKSGNECKRESLPGCDYCKQHFKK